MNDATTPIRRIKPPSPTEDAPGGRRAAPPPPGAGKVQRLPEAAPDDADRGPTEPPVAPIVFNLDDVVDLEARDGDVLVVSYPEVTLPLSTKYAMVKVGGSIYTRRLLQGESARDQFEKIYRFIAAANERAAQSKLSMYDAELRKARGDRE